MINQSKTLSASQVKNSFGTLVGQVYTGKYQEIIVENHGEPLVAIVSIKDLKEMKELKEQEKRKEALASLRAVRARVQARVKGKLTGQEAESIANRFSREFVEDLEKEGKITFEKNS